MKNFKRPSAHSATDPMAEGRRKAMKALGSVGIIFLAPCSLLAFMADRTALGVEFLVIALMLLADVIAAHRARRPPVPYPLFLLPLATSVFILIRADGLEGALWSFPATLFFFFVLSPRVALASTLILGTVSVSTVYHALGAPAAQAFGFCLALTIVIMRTAAWVISDAQEKLHTKAIRDTDTDAFNRYYIEPKLAEIIDSCRKHKVPVTLLRVEAAASAEGQQGHVMREIVAVFQKRLRSSDVVFRLDAQQLLVALPDTGEEDAVHVARQLRSRVAQCASLKNCELRLAIAASQHETDESIGEWLQSAGDTLRAARLSDGEIRARRQRPVQQDARPGRRTSSLPDMSKVHADVSTVKQS